MARSEMNVSSFTFYVQGLLRVIISVIIIITIEICLRLRSAFTASPRFLTAVGKRPLYRCIIHCGNATYLHTVWESYEIFSPTNNVVFTQAIVFSTIRSTPALLSIKVSF